MKKPILIILTLTILAACQSRSAKESKNNSFNKEHEVSVLQKQANEYLNNLNYIQAEELFLKAISIKPSSSLYLDLFRVYILQDKNQLADNAIKMAISTDKDHSDSYYLNAKYLFMKYKEDSIKIVLENFEKANRFGNKSAKDYIDVINTAEKYKKFFKNMNIDGLIEITYPDAMTNFYKSENTARDEFKKVFNQLNSLGGKIIDWNYFIPDQIFTNGNNKIAKMKVATTLLIKSNPPIQMPDEIIVISTNDGKEWYTMSYQESHKQYLSQFFNNETIKDLVK